MASVNVNVLVDEKYRDRFAEVVAGLQNAGMKAEQQLQSIGVITGSIDAAKVASLKQVKGVASVEESRQIRIAPPDSNVQ